MIIYYLLGGLFVILGFLCLLLVVRLYCTCRLCEDLL